MDCTHAFMPSPVGRLTLLARGGALVAVLWENDDPMRVRIARGVEAADEPVLVEAQRQLDEYFAGGRKVFSLPLAFDGTAFERAVWDELLKIPFGETRSYGQIAHQLGAPKAARAVGAANGKNPISIIAPCHRVIGASGRLTGFAGGLRTKAFLLEHEAEGDLFALATHASRG